MAVCSASSQAQEIALMAIGWRMDEVVRCSIVVSSSALAGLLWVADRDLVFRPCGRLVIAP